MSDDTEVPTSPDDDGPRPYLTPSGELRISMAGPIRYKHWIKGGMTLAQILDELEAPPEVRRRYLGPA